MRSRANGARGATDEIRAIKCTSWGTGNYTLPMCCCACQPSPRKHTTLDVDTLLCLCGRARPAGVYSPIHDDRPPTLCTAVAAGAASAHSYHTRWPLESRHTCASTVSPARTCTGACAQQGECADTHQAHRGTGARGG